ncbi:aminodeoxychorismate synthase component I [Magnetovibrio sp. PR-2]|uniref:aminodeoxychorismate synthase component I n=1 Tax=Magnetovibrio sp. PR-2 TaxID=3120356 RepID=UPI002FCE4918
MTLKPPFVLIDDAQTPGGATVFTQPVDIIICRSPGEITETFDRIEAALAGGHFVAGYMAYELGLALEDKLAPLLAKDLDTPLIWMGVFDKPHPLDAETFNTWAEDDYAVNNLHHLLSREDYIDQIERIRDHIRAGDVYQINHTFKQRFDFSGSPLALFAHLRKTQRAKYGALIATGEDHILSLSPELFFESDGRSVRTRPMKGTAPRLANPERDAQQVTWLKTDEKSRAENLMIVDLLRNDLGRISLVGSVHVTDLFDVETFPTVHQMTSSIEAKPKPGTTFRHITQALFPCGSVTGAPKVKAMELISGLEPDQRGVYTGGVGYSGPGGTHRYNVAIRTLHIRNDTGEIGIGGGIVYDSDPASEWEECHIKARFLTGQHEPFDLLETLKWDPQTGFVLLDHHMARMKASAKSFGYPFDEDAVRQGLDEALNGLKRDQRVRLLLNANGSAQVETEDLTDITSLTFELASTRIDRSSPFVYHKTTNRDFYDKPRAASKCDEVVFLNDAGELTEGSFTNLFVEIDGQLVTPPVQSGVLAGTLRQELLETGQCTEMVLFIKDLERANQIFLGNSVRGLVVAEFKNGA